MEAYTEPEIGGVGFAFVAFRGWLRCNFITLNLKHKQRNRSIGQFAIRKAPQRKGGRGGIRSGTTQNQSKIDFFWVVYTPQYSFHDQSNCLQAEGMHIVLLPQ